jgi:hypothetical protein
MMKSRLLILPFLLLLLLSNFSVLLGESLSSSHQAEIQPAEVFNSDAEGTQSQAVLFSSSKSGEAGVNSRNQLPQSNSEEDSKEQASALYPREATLEVSSFFYLSRCDQIIGSQSVKKLIFPFHTYL